MKDVVYESVWKPGNINMLPDNIQAQYLDMCMVHQFKEAARILQRAINSATTMPSVSVDGIMRKGRNRLVWLDDTVEVDTSTYTKQNVDLVKELRSQLEYFKTKVMNLESQLNEYHQELSQQRQRTDTIILKMTDQNQLLLESKPFWKFW